MGFSQGLKGAVVHAPVTRGTGDQVMGLTDPCGDNGVGSIETMEPVSSDDQLKGTSQYGTLTGHSYPAVWHLDGSQVWLLIRVTEF